MINPPDNHNGGAATTVAHPLSAVAQLGRPQHHVSPPAAGEGHDWQRSLTAIIRYRWWILAGTVLGTVAGAGASRVLPPRYLAQATIWIQSSDPRAVDRGQPIGANQLLAASAWTDLVKSYVVLDAVVRERRLYLGARPRDGAALHGFAVAERFQPGRYRVRVDHAGQTYRLEDGAGTTLETGKVGDSVGATLGFAWRPTAAELPPGGDVTLRVTALRDAAKELGDRLRVTIDPSGNFLRLTLIDPDATTAAAIVNAVVDRYLAVATEFKRAKLTELASLLGEQLRAAEANLHRAEQELANLRVHTIMLPPDPTAYPGATAPLTSPLNAFFELRIEREQLARDQQALAVALSQPPDSSVLGSGLGEIGAVQRAPDLTAALRELTAKRAEQRVLAYRYTADHPALRRLNDEIAQLEQHTIPALAQTLRAELAARERVVASQVASGGRALQGIPERAIEDARLRRDVSIAENLFATVQQRYSEARLAEASSIADVRVLDAAVASQAPVRDTAARLLALGLLVGLGLGVMGAVLVDRFDSRVRYADQVTDGMGLRILGALPHVKNREAGPDDEQVAQVIETMRSVRLSLVHAYGAAGPMVVTISSPGVGDGKSFVSTNLALACAQAGQRTLLIDGDTRRGSLHRVLQGSRKPGLTDFLAGRVSLETATQPLAYPSLHFIGAGRRVRESPELLGSAAMVDLLVRLRTKYQVILVDSPPLGSGVDPYTLGTLTGAMILVLRTGTTNLALARVRLGMLEQFPIRMLGVVLNDVQRGELYGYYSYVPGYGAIDEDAGTRVSRQRMQQAAVSSSAV